MAVRAEMVLMREALESFVAPEVATAVLFDALERRARPAPASLDEALEFARGSLASAVRDRLAPEDAVEVLSAIDQLFERAIDGDGVTVDVDVDDAPDADGASTHVLQVVRSPVPVLVVAGTGTFAERLVLCLGEDRVATACVTDDAGLRRSVFTHTPLIVLVDATAAPPVSPPALADAIRALPSNATPILWGAETPYGEALVARCGGLGVSVVTLARSEGIEPLLDLVLSRHHAS